MAADDYSHAHHAYHPRAGTRVCVYVCVRGNVLIKLQQIC